jgi:hypothetical protein
MGTIQASVTVALCAACGHVEPLEDPTTLRAELQAEQWRNSVQVEMTSAWDVFPVLGGGSFSMKRPVVSNDFAVTFQVDGAEPNQTYTVGFDVVPVTTFSTDAEGRGGVYVPGMLELQVGDDDLQFWWSRGSGFPIYYRSGERLGGWFAVVSR